MLGNIVSILLTFFLVPSTGLLAGFSKEVALDGIRYRVHMMVDRDCASPLEKNSIEAFQQKIDAYEIVNRDTFTGCFGAVFDVHVAKKGAYSFIGNGFVNRMVQVTGGVYSELETFYENDNIIADVELSAGEHRIYLYGKTPGKLTANRWGIGNSTYLAGPSHEYHRESFLIGALRGLCLGVLGIMALFFLFMTRENNRVFLIYGTFIAVNIIFIETLRSLVGELMGYRSGYYYFADWSLINQGFGTLTQLALGIFFGNFYEMNSRYPRVYKAWKIIYVLIALEIPIAVLKIPYGYAYTSFMIMLGAANLVCTALWFSIRRGGVYHLILVGYAIMLSCTHYFILTVLGIIPVTQLWSRDIHLFGSTIEVILFSIATSQKLNNKFALQKKANDHVLQQLQKIVYPHQLNRIREGAMLEQTMPVGKAEACVLAFDIIGSSGIQHEKVNDFIERAIKLCVSTMYDRYDEETLAADAYRIKVIGDGFLCSIGYPFGTPDSMHVGDVAVRLAMRMVRTFEQVEQEFQYHQPIHCAIGLAHGSIEGYYPQMGTKEYDLFGPAIVLATRYEQLRKYLFTPQNADYIILQESLYESLSPELQKEFTCIELAERQIRVRDDDKARRVYVWQSTDAGEGQVVA